ncbi:hypothetical protein F4779DRAFT_379221 [Xylariaceae sp. FL0662B]|nr:hypothetical protein F4779DRAFT_379221 [Xylariaceae sp. FL0662B]
MSGRRKIYLGAASSIITANRDEWEPLPEMQQEFEALGPSTSWLLPPIANSIWAAVFTRQSNNILLDIPYRVIAVYKHLRTLWNDFCLWCQERRKPWAVWTCQVGYAEPSENPKWRIKYTLEINRWEDVNTVFQFYSTKAKWVWKSSRRTRRYQQGRYGRVVWWGRRWGNPDPVPQVAEPLW